MKKTVLVTGGSRGIGRAIAIEFAKNGYNVIATCKNNKNEIIKLQSIIEETGASFSYYICDHSDFNMCTHLIEDILSSGMDIDVLVNNAGISQIGLLQDITKEDWDAIWNTNVTSTVAMCKNIIPVMLKKHSGAIINISSVWGNCGASCEVAYSATKGAINTFTKALAKELAPSGITVNAIACGIIDTDMNKHLSEDDVKDIVEDIPAGRIGTPEDIAKVTLSIANSPTYLTGQIITVDGGWT